MLEKSDFANARILLEALSDMDWFERSVGALRDERGLMLAAASRDDEGNLERDSCYVLLDAVTAQLFCATLRSAIQGRLLSIGIKTRCPVSDDSLQAPADKDKDQ